MKRAAERAAEIVYPDHHDGEHWHVMVGDAMVFESVHCKDDAIRMSDGIRTAITAALDAHAAEAVTDREAEIAALIDGELEAIAPMLSFGGHDVQASAKFSTSTLRGLAQRIRGKP